MDEVSLLRDRERSLLVGICTSDFSSLHDIVGILKDRHIPHTVLEPGSLWETGMDCLLLEKGVKPPAFTMKCPATVPISSDPLITVDRGVAASFGRDAPKELVAGVDPGKRPGVAFIADGILISALRAAGPSSLLKIIVRARKAYRPREIMVRVGDGDPDKGNSIITELRMAGFSVEIVDEEKTTRTRRYRDENAAVLIARTRGNPA
ncbi:MAG: hypothetical protein JW939_10030 [Candidatus Thermoplasmatota archaeon]|nr:hypothetical protein [Candidatus Thermoplasmatota archaeon]